MSTLEALDYDLVQNEFGYYTISWYCADAKTVKRKSTQTKNREKAEKIMEIFTADHEAVRRKNFRLDHLFDYYLEEHVEEYVIDKERIKFALKPLREHFGMIKIKDFLDSESGRLIRHYIAERRNTRHKKNVRAVGDATIRRELTTLKAVLNHARKTNRIQVVPFVQMPEAPRPRDFWLNEDEERAFLKLVQAEDAKFGGLISPIHRFVVLALETAARRNSIETLKWEQVDMERGVIHYEADGKRMKNKKRVAVPISYRLHKFLSVAIAERKDEWVLGANSGVYWQFVELRKKAASEINPRFEKLTPHDLRRTFATLAARAGVDLWQISGVLGDNISTVQRTYAHHSPDHLRAAVNFRG